MGTRPLSMGHLHKKVEESSLKIKGQGGCVDKDKVPGFGITGDMQEEKASTKGYL